MKSAHEEKFERDGVVYYGRMAEVASQMTDEDDDFFRLADILSDQIHDYMELNTISKAELARRLGSSRAYVTKILTGDLNVTLKTLTKILNRLGLKAEVKLVERSQHVSWRGLVKKLTPSEEESTSQYMRKDVTTRSGDMSVPRLKIYSDAA